MVSCGLQDLDYGLCVFRHQLGGGKINERWNLGMQGYERKEETKWSYIAYHLLGCVEWIKGLLIGWKMCIVLIYLRVYGSKPFVFLLLDHSLFSIEDFRKLYSHFDWLINFYIWVGILLVSISIYTLHFIFQKEKYNQLFFK